VGRAVGRTDYWNHACEVLGCWAVRGLPATRAMLPWPCSAAPRTQPAVHAQVHTCTNARTHTAQRRERNKSQSCSKGEPSPSPPPSLLRANSHPTKAPTEAWGEGDRGGTEGRGQQRPFPTAPTTIKLQAYSCNAPERGLVPAPAPRRRWFAAGPASPASCAWAFGGGRPWGARTPP
jgi:hypothetical protein